MNGITAIRDAVSMLGTFHGERRGAALPPAGEPATVAAPLAGVMGGVRGRSGERRGWMRTGTGRAVDQRLAICVIEGVVLAAAVAAVVLAAGALASAVAGTGTAGVADADRLAAVYTRCWYETAFT